jgi:dehydrogenase/reductase SDR family member 12
MSLFGKLLDWSVLFSYDRSGYQRHAKKNAEEEWRGEGKVAAITGANSGIGFAAAKELLSLGTEVHLLCRSLERGEIAFNRLKKEFSHSAVFLHQVDISDMKAVQYWSQKKSPEKIDILINNAGAMPETLTYNSTGDEITWATHLLGHDLLTMSLISNNRLQKGSRVIFVASGGLYLQRLNLFDLTWEEREYNKYTAYANAKRAQVILTELYQQNDTLGVLFSCMHPGWVNTPGVKKAMPAFFHCLYKRLRTPEQGADTVLWLAMTESSYPGGKFWFDRSEVSPHKFFFTKESKEELQAFHQFIKKKRNFITHKDFSCPD